MMITGAKKYACIAAAAVFFIIACGFSTLFAAETSGGQGVQPATPTLSSTEESVSFEDIVPDNIKTMEDYAPPFESEVDRVPYQFSIWRVLGSLALVVLMIVGVVYVMRLLMARGMRYDLKGKHIRVVDMMQLGTNRGLYLVEVGGKTVLIGSTEKGLSYLTEVDDVGEASDEMSFSEEGGVDFNDTLRQAARPVQQQEPQQKSETVSNEIIDQIKEKLRRLEEDQDRG